LYALQKEPDSTVAHYLGKIEVSGFSNNDVPFLEKFTKKQNLFLQIVIISNYQKV